MKKKPQTVPKPRVVRAPKPVRMAMAMVPLSEIAKPEMYRGRLTLAPSPLTEAQIKAIVAPTPKHIIKKRPGKGGGEWDYVPGWWFKKKANFVFGFAHDFEIMGERVDGDFITVKGKVTVREPKTGRVVATKSDFGGAAIKYLKGKPHTPEYYLDLPNDFKAAQTDCMKRCLVQFGFAMDVYGKSESVENGFIVEQESILQPKASIKSSDAPVVQHECENCANPMTQKEVEYSVKFFKGKQLCRNCQKLYKENKW